MFTLSLKLKCSSGNCCLVKRSATRLCTQLSSCLRSDPGCKEVTLFSLPGRRELVPQQDGPFTQWSSHTLELSGPFFPGAWAQVPFGRECMLVCLQTRSSSIACTHWLCQEMLERSWQCCLGVYALKRTTGRSCRVQGHPDALVAFQHEQVQKIWTS